MVKSRQVIPLFRQSCQRGRLHAYRQPPSVQEGVAPGRVFAEVDRAAGHRLAHAPQLSTSLSTRVSHPSASEPLVALVPPLQLSQGARHGKVQVLFAQPTPVFALGWQTVWQDPQCSGVWSETQAKLSGRPSDPGQHAGVAPEHGPPAPPQVQVPTHRLVEVREQVWSQLAPQ